MAFRLIHEGPPHGQAEGASAPDPVAIISVHVKTTVLTPANLSL